MDAFDNEEHKVFNLRSHAGHVSQPAQVGPGVAGVGVVVGTLANQRPDLPVEPKPLRPFAGRLCSRHNLLNLPAEVVFFLAEEAQECGHIRVLAPKVSVDTIVPPF